MLAVPTEFKKEIRGIVHGRSESGKTTFIEPETLVELNNTIAELEQEERFEIMRLLRELTNTLRPFYPLIREYHSLLTALDFIRAKAKFALEINAILPELNRNQETKLVKAFHPLLLLRKKSEGEQIVPLTISLTRQQRIVIISGPNAGGKSITLKTVGLLQLMLESGLLVPADKSSSMCFYNNLLADIGDNQSLEYALSTYSARLIRMNNFLKMAESRTLILIDEFGTGTDPELGGAIAEVVLEELNKCHAFGIFTTHYTNIKMRADQLQGVVNASMLFDERTFEPKYELVIGPPGSSYTFEVAERIGLSSEVISRAKQKVHGDKLKLNSLLSKLHSEKNELHRQNQKLKELQAGVAMESKRFQETAKRLETITEKQKEKKEENEALLMLGRKLDSLSREWESTKDKKAVIRKFVNQMVSEKKKKAAASTPANIEKKKKVIREKMRSVIQVGSKVRMLKGRQVGIVEDIRKDNVYVNFGTMKATVTLENLELAPEPASETRPKSRKGDGH